MALNSRKAFQLISSLLALLLFTAVVMRTALAESGWKSPDPEANWFWQLDNEGPLELPFDVWDVSLYDVSDQYLQSLKSQGVYIICYFSLGTSEEYNSDRADFQTADFGKTMEGYPTEMWVNPQSTNVKQIMVRRLEYAKSRGCDAVEPDNINYQDKETGFSVSPTQQVAYLVWFSQEAHKRGLAIGMKNNLDQAEILQPYFDFAVNEQCFEYEECAELEVFVNAGKAVFHAEYLPKYQTSEQERQNLCRQAKQLNFRTLVLNEELDGRYFYSCDLMFNE